MADENKQTKLSAKQTGNSATIQPNQKGTWPELVGVKAEEAERKIREEMPAVTQFQIIAQNSFVTMDHNPRRTRLFVDDTGNVVQAP